MIPRVYIDTSVIGGCLDEEFGEYSARLLSDCNAGRIIPVLSNITIAELRRAPDEVKALLDRSELKNAELIYLDEEAVSLAEEYINAGVVGEAMRVDILVSWNFKHIVKLSRIRGFNSVNMKLGYPELEIRSPREVYNEEV